MLGPGALTCFASGKPSIHQEGHILKRLGGWIAPELVGDVNNHGDRYCPPKDRARFGFQMAIVHRGDPNYLLSGIILQATTGTVLERVQGS